MGEGGAAQPPLVSVVVPAWDVAHLLPRCLDSLLAQTHRPLEIIAVDDGSRDGTGEVIADYAARHPEVHLVSQDHRGLGPARNAALSIAHGEFVVMVDADDVVEPDYLEALLEVAHETGADVVVCGFWFHSNGLRAPFPFLPPEGLLTGPETSALSLHVHRMPAFAWNKLYRRSLFHPDDPPFPAILYEDLATTTRVLRRARTVAITHRRLYHYCLRDDSITGMFGVKNVFSFAAAINLLRHDLDEQGLWDEWRPHYRALLREAAVMMGLQVLLQPTRIPLRARVPVMVRFLRRLRELAQRPSSGKRLRPVRLRSNRPWSTLPRRPRSAAVTVSQPR